MKQTRALILLAFFFLTTIISFSQSKDDEIKRLQNLLKESELRATRAEEMAKQYQEEANKAKINLERHRLHALARAFAEGSIELENKEHAGLLALTALNFIRKANGYEFDTDIYSGLINGLRNYNRYPQELKYNSESNKFIKEHNSIVYAITDNNQLVSWKN
jgi:hypothetical protein